MNLLNLKKAKSWIVLILLGSVLNTTYAVTTDIQPATDLVSLLSNAEIVNNQIANITLSPNNMCDNLKTANVSVAALIANIEILNAQLSAPLSINVDSLQALDDLSAVVSKMAASSTTLSLDLTTLNSTTDMLEISNALSALLSLADDIGTMANRILEMADKILIMADNIGLMADRIIVTQQIQSDNLALTQVSILATQQNSLALVSVLNSNTFTVAFNAETLSGNSITADIVATVLTQFNMAREWSSLATDVDALKAQILATNANINTAAATNTLTIDTESYAALADMSIMVNSISIAMQGLALATEALSSSTSDRTLSPSLDSILQMSADIGVMANSILEMADLILAMANNIGLTADQIIATQQLQSTDYAAILAAVDAAQITTINIIVAQSL